MIWIELLASLGCNVALAFWDKQAGTLLHNRRTVLKYSLLKTFLCALLAVLLIPFDNVHINLNGLLIALGAGICHAASVVLIMHALQTTYVVYVHLFLSAGIVLPALFGWVFFAQAATVPKLVCLPLIVIFSAFVLNVKRGKKLHLNLLCPMFLCYGLLMVMQNAFPAFCAGGSKTLFSTIMYGFSTVLLAIAYNCISGDAPRFSRKLYTFGAAAAVGNLAINLLLTDLSAKADAALVFPTVHGMKLIMITALSAFIWKEKLTVRQVSAALAAVICICVLAI